MASALNGVAAILANRGPLLLDLLQCGDNQKADDDEQKPGTDLADMDKMPGVGLIRVFPRAKEGGDILRNPNKEADQHEGEG